MLARTLDIVGHAPIWKFNWTSDWGKPTSRNIVGSGKFSQQWKYMIVKGMPTELVWFNPIPNSLNAVDIRVWISLGRSKVEHIF